LGIHQVWSPSLEITFNHGIFTTRRNFILPENLWLQVLNDYMYDFGHKLLLWMMCVENHSHILMGHVTSRWWSGNKMGDVSYHFYFIYMHYYKMWVQFINPHSLDQWIHSKSNEITWHTWTPFVVVMASMTCDKVTCMSNYYND
jgi:hypothetical protein